MIFYNPHVDDFLAEPLQFRILKRRALKKYGFIFDEARKDGATIRILIDGAGSGIIPEAIFHYLPRWLRLAVASLEFELWKHINDFGEKFERVPIPEAPVDDVLIAFSYKAATGRFQLREATLRYYHATIFHLSHYFVATEEKAENIRRLPNAYLAGDSDITGNPYFQRFFGWYNKSFLVLPFSVGDRFKTRQPWLTRDAKAVATGSFHDLRLEKPAHKYTDFIAATGVTSYHPVRLGIYQAAEQLSNWVTCKISPYRQYGQNRLSRLFSHFRVAQKKYFSINIVDLYNQHRYAIVGEELSGFPALGALEAMACGCVLIGQPQYYAGLDLQEGRDFLPYDGSMERLVAILQSGMVTEHEAIAQRAAIEVNRLFSPRSAYARWQEALKKVH